MMSPPVDRRSLILVAAAVSAGASAAMRPMRIVLIGYNDMEEMLTGLNAGFTKRNPGVAVEMRLPGTRFAPDALAAGQATLAPMGARFTPEQLAKFFGATGTQPMGFRIAHASLDPKALSGPNGIFVQRSNPLRAIDLDFVRVLFTRPGPYFWRQAGVRGPLRDQPILVTGLRRETPLALEFGEAAFPGRNFSDAYHGYSQSRDVIDFIGQQPGALGFAALNRATDRVQSMAIRRMAGAPPIEATPVTLQNGLYPLDRHLWLYARQQGHGQIALLARAYLAFVLSREGQAIIAAGSLGYLPLGEAERRTELAKFG
jgi:phosphate transport system substrate-binding protein